MGDYSRGGRISEELKQVLKKMPRRKLNVKTPFLHNIKRLHLRISLYQGLHHLLCLGKIKGRGKIPVRGGKFEDLCTI